MWKKIRQRRDLLRELRHRIDLNRWRMIACDTDMVRIGDLGEIAYRILWRKKLDYYQENLVLKRGLVGRDNWFWILTGKRWLLHLYMKRLWMSLPP